jgi:PAS domain S-box-containing protein
MFLEGQIDWVLVFGVAAALGWMLALFGLAWALTHRSRHVDASGQLNLVQRVAEDSQKRLFETLNAIPVALVETDRQGKFVFANRAAHQLLGRKDAELIGLRFHSATWGITFPDGRPVPPDMLPSARALRGQTVKGFHHLLANPQTRRKMLVAVTAMPIENERGEITGSTAAIVETEGLQTLEVVSAEPVPEAAPPVDDLTRRVFDAAASALAVVDAEGRIRDLNRTARRVLGRSDDVTGLDFADLFLTGPERAPGRQALRAAMTAPAGDAEPILSRQGGETGIRWSILPLADAGEAQDALLLAGERAEAETSAAKDGVAPETPDQTPVAELEAARSQAEAALAAAEVARTEAAEARRAAEQAELQLQGGRRMENVGRLTGGVAHDFAALLGVMTGALDMMLRQADDPARVRRLGQAALAAGQRGEALTRRLTAFAQGDDEPVVRSIDAGVLLRGMESRLRAMAGPGIDLLIEGPNEPVDARLDPVAFEGAVQALTRNAIEAVAAQGSVAVRLETLLEGGLRLSVRDSGPGMDRELAARAIEPFFTTREGAAGLGLSQAYAFARQSGGVLSIDSNAGEGAEVAITLPAPPNRPDRDRL